MEKSNKELQIIAKNPPIGSLEAYIQWANGIPMLSKEEEFELATKLEQKNDLQAAQKLVTAHLKYVIKVARSYMGYGLMLGDLIQEGAIGLMKAVKKFQPNKGVRLVSFAIHWIKAEIHEFVLKNWRIVKVATTKSQRKLFFNLRSKKGTNWLTKDEISAIAQDLNVKESEVVTMEKRLHAVDTSFDLPTTEDETKYLPSPKDYLEADNSNPLLLLENKNWNEHTKEQFKLGFSKLDDRAKDIIASRWLQESNVTTLQELASKYHVSSERIRQLEKSAIEQLKKFIAN